MRLTLIYVMDFHCGWCFGFGKTILKIFEHYKNDARLKFEVLPGGLFVPKIKGSKEFADGKRPIIKRIEQMSGTKFSEEYISNILGDGYLDSEIPAQILNAFKTFNQKEIIYFMEDLFEEQFVNAKNLSNFENAIATIEKYGIDEKEFKNIFESEEMKIETKKNFEKAHTFASSYPQLFARDEDGTLYKLAIGFSSYENLKSKINEIINDSR